MNIYVVSDSHNSLLFGSFLEKIEDADAVFHLGDGERDKEDLKAVVSCPVTSVKGNCDFFGKDEEIVDIGGVRIYLTHGHMLNVKASRDRLVLRAKEAGAQIALYGHTHVPEISNLQGVWVINPGSLTRPRGNYVKTYCIINIENDKIYPKLMEF